MHRWDIINHIIEKKNYKNYLEIGVRWPNDTFNKINISHKDAVDPEPKGPEINYPVTSDAFFELIKDHKEIKYDIIFIDGLHLMEQVDKDIENSLKHLTDDGIIVLHDCNPITEFRQREEYEVNGEFPAWNGTVWKSWVKLRCSNPDLEMFVINSDEGCGVIRKGKQKIWDKDDVNKCIEYSYLDNNRTELLNLVSIGEFYEKI
tara:strand:- start:5621 stop:6232 length:612 start_codon:yes stop_codon:yes gene_type:complete